MGRKRRRLSDEAASILRVFLDEPSARLYGLQLIAMTGLPSGSVYPILIRLEERGLLRGELESVDAATAAGRRPRRYYSLRSAGADEARSAVDEWQRTKSLREASFGSRLRERPA